MWAGRAWTELVSRRMATQAGGSFLSLWTDTVQSAPRVVRGACLCEKAALPPSGGIAKDSTCVPHPSDFPQVNACDQKNSSKISS